MIDYIYWHEIGMHDSPMFGCETWFWYWLERNSTKVSWWCLIGQDVILWRFRDGASLVRT